ncbi:MAG: pirin family protein [Candidatus Sericytochromatia bacterium]
MSESPLRELFPLGFPWPTLDPFLFCVYHADAYPAGNDALGPATSLKGRQLGQDFVVKDGWRMYHGEVVPGFPGHPHRGFETVTAVLHGYVDHADSQGACGRYGPGDVQWMTAGKGLQHAEMFPLLDPKGENPLELFQIWLNLPGAKKFVEPYYGMLWNEAIPTWVSPQGPPVTVRLLAGTYTGLAAPPPPPDSWAADPANEVAIWTIRMAPGASWTLPAATAGLNRCLYFYQGQSLQLDTETITSPQGVVLQPDRAIELKNGTAESCLLLLQGRPIGEPVAQYGPFVMNSEAEIQQAFRDYQRDQFVGWPWSANDPVLPRDQGRFARYADGKEEKPVNR